MNAIEQVKSIGSQLSNVAFNWAQNEGRALTANDCAMLDSLRRKWDAAIATLSAISAEPVGHVDMQTPGPGDRIRWTNAAMPHGTPLYASPLPQAAQPERAAPGVPEESRMELRLPTSLHRDSQALVISFAEAMAEKLHKAEQKYGYSNGWMDKGWLDECRQKLIEHLAKGDPRDVANYCAFLWWHNEKTASPSLATERDVVDAQKVRDVALKPKWVGEFATFPQWVNHAQDALASPNHRPAVCIDAIGRRCTIGKDFMTARDEGTFPIRYFWEFEQSQSIHSTEKDAEDARRFKPRELVTLNGKQLKDLLDYAWPDKDDEDQADSELTLIAHDTPFKSTEGDDMPAGLYCYCTEYPEEGIILIDEKDATK